MGFESIISSLNLIYLAFDKSTESQSENINNHLNGDRVYINTELKWQEYG